MSKTKQTPSPVSDTNGELLKLQTSAQETGNSSTSSELYTRNEIKGTPFSTVTDNEKNETFLAIGHKRLTPGNESQEYLRLLVEQKDWDILLNLICILAEGVYHKLNQIQQS